MKIKYIDGNRLSRAIIAGASRIFDRQDYLNKINVFPVPDSDTGTNMASTMRAIVDSISGTNQPSLSELSNTIAESALLGARGNSGVILAQYLYGVAQEIGDDIHLTTERFGRAVRNAVQYAYNALMTPREGTILTVMREWSEQIYSQRSNHTDFAELLNQALERANQALSRTTEKIAALRSAKVVDAGAQGFVDFLEGITSFISRGRIKDIQNYSPPKITGIAHTDTHLEDIKYRYCTECLIDGKGIDIAGLKGKIKSFGDSIVVAGSSLMARLHIHTDKPEEVFAIARKSGDLLQQKADDMLKQFRVAHAEHARIALVTDSACDLPEKYIDENCIHVVPVRVSFGKSSYIDKITIKPGQFYEMLMTESGHPTTSQPPPSDFKNMYSFLLSHYDSIISIHLTGASSGTYQNATSAAKMFPDREITVIDGKSLSIGLGFIVEKASQLISEGRTHSEVVSAVQEFRGKTQMFVNIHSLKYLMRSGRVSKMKGWLGNFLHLKPILHLDENGVPQHCEKSFSDSGAMKKVLNLVREFTHGKSNVRFAVAHAKAPEIADYYVSQLEKTYGVKGIPILPAAPVLGAHAGIGAGAIAVSWQD